ncbi:Ras GTPase-activating protein-binding protein 1 [Halotydeus destructor]|nr:Ras GTPase-activating protein-binding protein 1 [Halotydeus destructor]
MRMVMETIAARESSIPPPVAAQATEGSNGAPNQAASAVHQPPFNPQSLGREFVRQYYTVLNQAPQFLHRFYSDDSSFIHGSLSKPGEITNPVYGQAEINSKIISLSFKDCHTKVRQVDSLETIGKSVVVQVTGELSNDGRPLRRFFQTFVLAPKSSTNYYVRNDIFRYQDEIFVEDDRSDVETEVKEPEKTVLEPEAVNIPLTHEESAVVSELAVNGNHLTDNEKAGEPIELPPGAVPVAVTKQQPLLQDEPWDMSTKGGDQARADPVLEENFEPRTYANMAARIKAANAAKNARALPVVSQPLILSKSQQQHAEVANVLPLAPVSPAVPSLASDVPPVTAALPNEKSPGQGPREQRQGQRTRGQPNRNRESFREQQPLAPTAVVGVDQIGEKVVIEGEEDRADRQKVAINYPDEQQVFVGNLPSDITEEQLGSWFSKFGRILDIRINRTNQKTGTNRTPNYGFVTFDDAAIVKSILSQKPIYFNEHRFNVEEKRSQPRGQGSGRGGNIQGQGGPLNNGGGRRDFGQGPRQYDRPFREGGGPRRDDRQQGGRSDRQGERDNQSRNNVNRPFPNDRPERRTEARANYNKQPR